jgi:hypothetical protein
MRKANAAAADQAARAKQAVSSGLKNLASQAGAVLGQVLNDTPSSRLPVMTTAEALNPSRHSRESGNPALNTLGKMDPGLRRDDALRGDDRRRDGSGLTDQDEAVLPPLPDETISSNQRLATALSKRRGIGDLPRFTTDAINTDPSKAIPEIADLLRQVHASDPAQANDLFSQTMQGITPEHGQALQRAMQSYGQSDSKKLDGVNADQISDADFMASPVYPVSANFGVREPANVQVEQKTPPPDPGQDDPEEPTEPKDPGQDDPEDPCAVYETAVADAEANVEALKAHADELEREMVDLANLVNEKEHQKLQIEDTLLGLGVSFEGAKYHPSSIIFLFNNATGQTEEEYKRKRENLQNDLNVLSDEVKKMRDKMHESRKERQAMNGRIAYARGQVAQAKANLRRCEQG